MEPFGVAKEVRHPRFRCGGFSPPLHSSLFPQRRRAAALRTSCGDRYTAEAKKRLRLPVCLHQTVEPKLTSRYPSQCRNMVQEPGLIGATRQCRREPSPSGPGGNGPGMTKTRDQESSLLRDVMQESIKLEEARQCYWEPNPSGPGGDTTKHNLQPILRSPLVGLWRGGE